MTNFAYTTTEPASNTPPAQSQPTMLTNCSSIAGILEVDHVGFNTSNGGFHKQVTFNDVTSPSAPVNPQSILYSKYGVAQPSVPQGYFISSAGSFPVNLIKAAGVIVVPSTSVSNCFNIDSVSYAGGPPPFTYTATVTLTSGVTSGSNVIVFASARSGAEIAYSFSSGVLTITGLPNAESVDFMIMQI